MGEGLKRARKAARASRAPKAGVSHLTDNEKAASYIGWKRERCCIVYSKAARRVFASAASTSFCECGAPYSEVHDIPAPAMRQPENYMRALLAASQHRRIEIVLLGMGCTVTIFRDPRNQYIAAQGETPVAALAALYDTEHAEGKP